MVAFSADHVYTLQRITIVQQPCEDLFDQTPDTEQKFGRRICPLSQVVRMNLISLLFGYLLCVNSS